VEYVENSGMHHMTLSTLGLSTTQLDPGEYDCADLYGNASMMSEQIMFFGAQGDAEGEMSLPEGVAATLPANISIIHEVHYVNTTDQPVEVYSLVNAWTMPTEDVKEGIWGHQVRDENITIPANSDKTEWTRCLMNEDVDVIFLGSHTHGLGTEFTVALYDGTTTGDVFYRNNDLHSPGITQYDTPIHLSKGQGLEYSCTWHNPSSTEIHYGLTAADEMCNLAIVHTPLSMSARCEVVETSDGVLYVP
jgi:hypothetical protein